jgi:hypothetical protein
VVRIHPELSAASPLPERALPLGGLPLLGRRRITRRPIAHLVPLRGVERGLNERREPLKRTVLGLHRLPVDAERESRVRVAQSAA